MPIVYGSETVLPFIVCGYLLVLVTDDKKTLIGLHDLALQHYQPIEEIVLQMSLVR